MHVVGGLVAEQEHRFGVGAGVVQPADAGHRLGQRNRGRVELDLRHPPGGPERQVRTRQVVELDAVLRLDRDVLRWQGLHPGQRGGRLAAAAVDLHDRVLWAVGRAASQRHHVQQGLVRQRQRVAPGVLHVARDVDDVAAVADHAHHHLRLRRPVRQPVLQDALHLGRGVPGHPNLAGVGHHDHAIAVHLQPRQGLGGGAGGRVGLVRPARAEQPGPGLVDRHRQHIAWPKPVHRAVGAEAVDDLERTLRALAQRLDHGGGQLHQADAERVVRLVGLVEHLVVARPGVRHALAAGEQRQGGQGGQGGMAAKPGGSGHVGSMRGGLRPAAPHRRGARIGSQSPPPCPGWQPSATLAKARASVESTIQARACEPPAGARRGATDAGRSRWRRCRRAPRGTPPRRSAAIPGRSA